MERKRQSGELGLGQPDPVLDTYVISEMERIQAFVETLPDERMDVSLLNQIVWAEVGL